MYLYNITIHIEWQQHDDFLQWLHSDILPELLGKKYFSSYKFFELLGTDEKEGKTYSLQLTAESIGAYNRFAEIYREKFFERFAARWGERCYLFPSLLREVDSGAPGI